MGARRAIKLAGEPVPGTFVAYYRVSTEAQGVSGLGLDAQRTAIDRHVLSAGGKVVAEFREIESGKRNDRPEIAKAIAACRARRATLIIAKLDRLARNVAFISNLMESGVEFVAADMPMANRLTVHILAAVAEHERQMISERTIAALAAAKARGVKLGNPQLRAGSRACALRAARTRAEYARKRAAEIMPYIDAARRAGCFSLNEIATALIARGIPTPGGAKFWRPEQVRRIINKVAQA